MKSDSSFSKLIGLFILPSELCTIIWLVAVYFIDLKKGADWCKKQSGVNGLLNTFLFFLQFWMQTKCQSLPILYHSTISIQKQPSWKWGNSKNCRSERWGRQSPVLYLRDEQDCSDKIQEITSKTRSQLGRMKVWWNYYCCSAIKFSNTNYSRINSNVSKKTIASYFAKYIAKLDLNTR